MFGYATDLRSRTQGRAAYSMFFDRYEQAPRNVRRRSDRPRAGNEVSDRNREPESGTAKIARALTDPR